MSAPPAPLPYYSPPQSPEKEKNLSPVVNPVVNVMSPIAPPPPPQVVPHVKVVPPSTLLPPTPRVCVIGGGIAGLGCAYSLRNTNKQITLISPNLGGNAKTLTLPDGTVPTFDKSINIDVGFMVYNNKNYRNMIKLFSQLDVQSEPSDMSLSISLLKKNNRCYEFSSASILANLWNLFDPSFYRLLSDMKAFNADIQRYPLMVEDDPRLQTTISSYISTSSYSPKFVSRYLLPMCSALWSLSPSEVLSFPISLLSNFLVSHDMVTLGKRQPWLTVKNRSKTYVNAIAEEIEREGGVVEFGEVTRVERKMRRTGCAWEVFSGYKSFGIFETIVFAVPPPTAKFLLRDDPKSSAYAPLAEIVYSNNEIYVHSDPQHMPRNERAWCSWNCLGDETSILKLLNNESDDEGKKRMSESYVTYHLNKLQNLKTSKNYFVTLNPPTPPTKSKIHQKLQMFHPVYTLSTLRSIKTVKSTLQGKDGLYFCGAWDGYGFHEDGLRSGINVANLIAPEVVEKAESAELFPAPVSFISRLWTLCTVTVPVKISKYLVLRFLRKAITQGRLTLKLPANETYEIGDPTSLNPVVVKVFDPWFFASVAYGMDLGLARSYAKGLFNVLPSATSPSPQTSPVLGDPDGLARLFQLFVENRDRDSKPSENALMSGSGLVFSFIGRFFENLRYTLMLDNSERGGSKENIRKHYDLSNELFMEFLDDETRMYSSAVFDGPEMKGTLGEAQERKLDILCERAGLDATCHLLDIGFGWGGLSIHAAKKFGCKVTGITLSVEQNALATKRMKALNLEHLISFEIVDYRTFAKRKENFQKFDRAISCEMIEAVGHDHLGEFFESVQKVLNPAGCLVMEAITTPEVRYEEYRKSTDFISSVIFPGSCCPSLHALVDAAYKNAPSLRLQKIDDYGVHYAETLREWRRRFNANVERVTKLGFDDEFQRLWNYYFTYCEAGFESETENLLVLVFGAPGWKRQSIVNRERRNENSEIVIVVK